MKTILLHKCRESIMILNNYGFPATKRDKRVRVVRFGYTSCVPLLSTQKNPVYENYGNAVNRRNKAILEMARELINKPWYYFILH